jgi:hypothetical protein
MKRLSWLVLFPLLYTVTSKAEDSKAEKDKTPVITKEVQAPKKKVDADQIFTYFSGGVARKTGVYRSTGKPIFEGEEQGHMKHLTAKEIEEECGAPDKIDVTHFKSGRTRIGPHLWKDTETQHELWSWERGGITVMADFDLTGDDGKNKQLCLIKVMWGEKRDHHH